ncbi:hypothetical protein EES39_33830 [Streptomyces sp. ADI92-24]|nr:hypothetical protein EES39_33830 [Streptomyces sp. ADI92-24]
MAVDGWMNLSRQIGAHKPHTDTWRQLDEEARNGVRPAGWERVPDCGARTAGPGLRGPDCGARTAGPGLRGPDCDEVTRTHEIRGEQGLPSLQMCGACHPALRF